MTMYVIAFAPFWLQRKHFCHVQPDPEQMLHEEVLDKGANEHWKVCPILFVSHLMSSWEEDVTIPVSQLNWGSKG